MVYKQPELKDQYLLAFILGKLVNVVCDCDLIYQNQVNEREQYPYVTYNFISPMQEVTSDWLGKVRPFTCLLQIDCHAHEPFEANQMATKLNDALHDEMYRHFFNQAKIVPQIVTNTQDRTSLAGINYDCDFGFDCSFEVLGGITYKKEELDFNPIPNTTIKTIDTTEEN
ncbi:hypothetical protein J2Z60_001069 [Lactobacillus colini]|uniref:Phage neck terminator protein gp12-like domain-containing protein n=1 Tax=Lactobacillus colini TaxID=1819254 RepID=A0ABS4MDX3_9LACO|nr:hypothetical protein [Lactobacillus colini]MBP2057894.1 hypothetical protein [Lactobacillus colini]